TSKDSSAFTRSAGSEGTAWCSCSCSCAWAISGVIAAPAVAAAVVRKSRRVIAIGPVLTTPEGQTALGYVAELGHFGSRVTRCQPAICRCRRGGSPTQAKTELEWATRRFLIYSGT